MIKKKKNQNSLLKILKVKKKPKMLKKVKKW